MRKAFKSFCFFSPFHHSLQTAAAAVCVCVCVCANTQNIIIKSLEGSRCEINFEIFQDRQLKVVETFSGTVLSPLIRSLLLAGFVC